MISWAKARPQNAGPHAEHIGIVVLSGFGSRIAVIAKGCADALHLIGRNAHADSRAADEDALIPFAAGNGFSHLLA